MGPCEIRRIFWLVRFLPITKFACKTLVERDPWRTFLRLECEWDRLVPIRANSISSLCGMGFGIWCKELFFSRKARQIPPAPDAQNVPTASEHDLVSTVALRNQTSQNSMILLESGFLAEIS